MTSPLRRYRVSDRVKIGEPDSDNRFVVGTTEEYGKWVEQLIWWLGDTRKNLENPKEQAHADATGVPLAGQSHDRHAHPQCFARRRRPIIGEAVKCDIHTLIEAEMFGRRRKPSG